MEGQDEDGDVHCSAPSPEEVARDRAAETDQWYRSLKPPTYDGLYCTVVFHQHHSREEWILSTLQQAFRDDAQNTREVAEEGEIREESPSKSRQCISVHHVYADFVVEGTSSRLKGTVNTCTPPPLYHQIPMAQPLVKPEDDESSNELVEKTGSSGCFNCGSNGHRLPECPESIDRDRIRANRDKYFLSKPLSSGVHRYFDPRTDSIDLTEFKPGQLTSRLREALGLAAGDIPPFIGRMMHFGFPPAYQGRVWKNNAERSSTLEVYDDAGFGARPPPPKRPSVPCSAPPLPLRPMHKDIPPPRFTLTPEYRCSKDVDRNAPALEAVSVLGKRRLEFPVTNAAKRARTNERGESVVVDERVVEMDEAGK